MISARLIVLRLVSVALVAFFGPGLVGCASQQAELPPQMTTELVGIRDQLVQGKAQLQTTCNAARDLTTRPQSQLEPQVNRLISSITSLEAVATNNRTQFASADERAQAYFAHWAQQMNGMSESLKEEGEARRAESVASFNELKVRTEALRSEFRPFMASLNEVSRYLKTDTTAAGVRAVTPQLNAALNRENALMQKVDAVIAQIDSMRGGK